MAKIYICYYGVKVSVLLIQEKCNLYYVFGSAGKNKKPIDEVLWHFFREIEEICSYPQEEPVLKITNAIGILKLKKRRKDEEWVPVRF